LPNPTPSKPSQTEDARNTQTDSAGPREVRRDSATPHEVVGTKSASKSTGVLCSVIAKKLREEKIL
jgi:hypothetical protein